MSAQGLFTDHEAALHGWGERREATHGDTLLDRAAYRDFNGSRTNYGCFGRDAKDNNTVLLMAWLMF
jgi:hypothetical protein